METITINKPVRTIVDKIIVDALAYEKITGRKLGITGEVAEVMACDKLELKLMADPLSAGYDAVDEKGKKYQIKSKRITKNNRGRVGTFSKHRFDFLILILLDKNYKVIGIWKADYKKIEPLINKQKRRNPVIRDIIKIANEIL